MSKLFLAEITIKVVVLASNEKKACEDALVNVFADVPLGNILTSKVVMKAKEIE